MPISEAIRRWDLGQGESSVLAWCIPEDTAARLVPVFRRAEREAGDRASPTALSYGVSQKSAENDLGSPAGLISSSYRKSDAAGSGRRSDEPFAGRAPGPAVSL